MRDVRALPLSQNGKYSLTALEQGGFKDADKHKFNFDL